MNIDGCHADCIALGPAVLCCQYRAQQRSSAALFLVRISQQISTQSQISRETKPETALCRNIASLPRLVFQSSQFEFQGNRHSIGCYERPLSCYYCLWWLSWASISGWARQQTTTRGSSRDRKKKSSKTLSFDLMVKHNPENEML